MNTINTIVATDVFGSVVGQITTPTEALDSPLGNVIRGFLLVVGVIIVVAGVAMAFKHIAQGKMSKAVSTLLGAGVVAAFMFFPQLLVSLVDILRNVIEALFGTASDVTRTSGGGGSRGG